MGLKFAAVNTTQLIIVGAAALTIYLVGREIKKWMVENPQYFDMTDDRNLAYQGTNAIGEGITGQSNWDLGTQLCIWTGDCPADWFEQKQRMGIQ